MNSSTEEQREIVRKRELRKALYKIQDLEEIKIRTNNVGIVCLFIGLLWLLTYLIFKGNCLIQSSISIAVGATILAASKLEWFESLFSSIIALVAYLSVFVIEFFTIGLPSRLYPGFGETENYKVINILTIINDLTPILFYGIQIALAIIFALVIYHSGKVAKIPSSTLKELEREGMIKVT